MTVNDEVLAGLRREHPAWEIWRVDRYLGGPVWCARPTGQPKPVLNAGRPAELSEYITSCDSGEPAIGETEWSWREEVTRRLQAVADGLSSQGLITQLHESGDALDVTARCRLPSGRETELVLDEDGWLEVQVWAGTDAQPEQVTALTLRVLAAVGASPQDTGPAPHPHQGDGGLPTRPRPRTAHHRQPARGRSLQSVSGAPAQQASGEAGGVFTEAAARAALEQACQTAGLDPVGVQLLRLGENAVFHLAAPVVARVARTAAYAPAARTEVAVARWLQTEDFPAVRALNVDQPVLAGEFVVTFWESLSNETEWGTAAELGVLLARLHYLTPPAEVGLEPLRPFARVDRRIDGNGWFSPEDRSFLRTQLADLQARYAQLDFILPAGVIHGDASVGNAIHDRDGRPVLIDLDGVAIGPREWDLAVTALYYDSFGWHTKAEYEAFVKAYGFDVMTWPGYPVLRDIKEFLMVTWLSQKAGQDERSAAEVRKRITALRTGASRRDWRPY